MTTRLNRVALQRGVRLPQPATLKVYGWTLPEWLAMLDAQGWVCPLCGRFPKEGKFVTDHEHVRGWKKMPPEQRKLYVRGLTCWTCNKFMLQRGMTTVVASNIVVYLERYLERRP